MGRVRLALKSDLATEANDAVESQAALLSRPKTPTAAVASAPAATPFSASVREALEPYKDLKRQAKVSGCLELVDVREMVAIYRRFRDSATEPIPASDVVHAILSTLRLRMVVLRPLISIKRHDALNNQNPELKSYLEEIVQDMLAGKAYLSTFALTYLLTAFGTLNCHAEATKVWRQLSEQEKLPKDLSKRIYDPKVVGSFIRFADPQSVSLEEIETTYENTVRSRGHHILLDDALATSYLRFGETVRAAELYAHMCRSYPVKKWEDTFSRLHNRILTESQDHDLSNAFFESAVEAGSRIKLHPSSAAKYVEHIVATEGEPARIVDVYRQAVERFATKANYVAPLQYQVLTTTAVRCLLAAYEVDNADARIQLARFLPLDTSSVVALNTLLSFVSKRWPVSSYIEDIMGAVASRGPLRVDSLRVFLNASQHLPSQSLAAVQDLWAQRQALSQRIDRFDLLALLHACNSPDRAAYFVSELEAARANGLDVSLVEKQLSHYEHVAAAVNKA